MHERLKSNCCGSWQLLCAWPHADFRTEPEAEQSLTEWLFQCDIVWTPVSGNHKL